MQKLDIEHCPCCRGVTREPWIRAMGFDLVRCGGCGHRYATQMIDPGALSVAYYDEADEHFDARTLDAKRARMKEYRALLADSWDRRGRVLDVGCNAGELLSLFEGEGWEVAGIDLSRRAVERARTRVSGPIWNGRIEDEIPQTEQFDLIVLSHVLEHLPEPVDVLASLRPHLRSTGKLLIEVPSASDPLLRIWGGVYRPLCPGDHVSFFDARSLREVLRRAGLDVEAELSPTHAWDVFYPSLLSGVDWLRTRGGAKLPEAGKGVVAQTRYRGRFRRPLKELLDRAVQAVDPVVHRVAARFSPQAGPVVIVKARPA